LGELSQELESVLDELRGPYAADLTALHSLSQDPSSFPPPSHELERTVELLDAVQTALTPPLHTLVDGMFGMKPCLHPSNHSHTPQASS
jgi:hypothetical protein